MKDAQQEIKSTVTVNTTDIAAKSHESKQDAKDFVNKSGKQCKLKDYLITVRGSKTN